MHNMKKIISAKMFNTTSTTILSLLLFVMPHRDSRFIIARFVANINNTTDFYKDEASRGE